MEQHEIRRAALRGLVPTVVTVAVLVGGAVGARAGTGIPGLAVALAAACAIGGAFALVAIAAVRWTDRSAARVAPDLGTEWARIEPRWSGRR